MQKSMRGMRPGRLGVKPKINGSSVRQPYANTCSKLGQSGKAKAPVAVREARVHACVGEGRRDSSVEGVSGA